MIQERFNIPRIILWEVKHYEKGTLKEVDVLFVVWLVDDRTPRIFS